MQLQNSNRTWIAVAAAMSGLIIFSGYFLERYETLPLLASFSALFGLYILLVRNRLGVSWKIQFTAGLFMRLCLLFMIPNLSDDLYRFIWDGQLTWHGIHPFAELPSTYYQQALPDFLSGELYHQLNSPDYFTVYPPVSQFFFLVMAPVANGDVLYSAIFLRVLLIAAECGTYFLMREMAFRTGIDPRRISWYWLNPLVILEITGNLHLEGFMIFFVFLGLVLLYSGRIPMAGAAFGLAAGVKLIPVLFLPVLWKHMGTRAFIKFSAALAGVLLLFSLPFFDLAFVSGMQDSLALYFRKFEFNASIYFLVREAGFWYKGYNIIASAGPYLAGLTFAGVVFFAWRHKPVKWLLTSAMGITLSIYLGLATTVHPWYILILIALMIYQKVYYPVLWSFLILFSYAGYNRSGYEENLYLTFIEYALVFIYLYYELFQQKKLSFNPLYRIPMG